MILFTKAGAAAAQAAAVAADPMIIFKIEFNRSDESSSFHALEFNINISVTIHRNYNSRTIGLNSHAVIC